MIGFILHGKNSSKEGLTSEEVRKALREAGATNKVAKWVIGRALHSARPELALGTGLSVQVMRTVGGGLPIHIRPTRPKT